MKQINVYPTLTYAVQVVTTLIYACRSTRQFLLVVLTIDRDIRLYLPGRKVAPHDICRGMTLIADYDEKLSASV